MFEAIGLQDARTLFGGCLARKDKEPVYIKEVDIIERKVQCVYYDLDQKKVLGAEVPQSFNFEPVELGYVTEGGQAYFVRRKPVRQYSMGLKAENVAVDLPKVYTDKTARDVMLLKGTGLRDCILGKFDSLRIALDKLENGVASSIGVSRSFAVSDKFEIFYRNKFVGVVNSDNGSPTFLNGKGYLKLVWGQNA